MDMLLFSIYYEGTLMNLVWECQRQQLIVVLTSRLFTSFLQTFKQLINTVIQNTYTLNFTKSKLSGWLDVSLYHVCIMCVRVNFIPLTSTPLESMEPFTMFTFGQFDCGEWNTHLVCKYIQRETCFLSGHYHYPARLLLIVSLLSYLDFCCIICLLCTY